MRVTLFTFPVVVVVALLSLVYVNSSRIYYAYYVDKEGSDHCFESKDDIGSMKKNEVRRLNHRCVRVKCTESRIIEYTECSSVTVEHPCYQEPGNLSKPYPECCFEIKCV